jgi:uncharacterized protein
MKTTKAQIDEFLSMNRIVLAGYSTHSRKFGAMVYNALKEKGYSIFPVNPAGGLTPDGENIYRNLDELPEDVKAICVVTKPEVSETIVNDALKKGFTHFWVQQMSENSKVLEALGKAPVAITGQCIILHTNPGGFHKVHLWFAKLFRMMPT